MIGEGQDPNQVSDSYGWTPLMFAAKEGHEEIARFLLKAGAHINVRSGAVPASFETTGDYPPTTALTEAIGNRHFDLAHFLLDHGANVDPYSFAVAGGEADLDLLIQMAATGIDIDSKSDNEFNRTALSAAARSGNLANMIWLIEHGADPNLALPHTSNLQNAIRGLQPEAVEALIAAGANPNEKIGSLETSPLWEAIYGVSASRAQNRSISIIEILLRNGADSEYRPGDMGRTMVDDVEYHLMMSDRGGRNPAYDAATQERYRQSADTYRKILALLRSKWH